MRGVDLGSLQESAKTLTNPEFGTSPPQDADELFDAFKCIETLLIQRRSQMAAWSSLSVVAHTTADAPAASQPVRRCSTKRVRTV